MPNFRRALQLIVIPLLCVEAHAATIQLTNHAASGCTIANPTANGSASLVAFESTCDLTGGNSDLNREIFQIDLNGSITQLTDTEDCSNEHPSSNAVGDIVAFDSDCDFGSNADRSVEIFVAEPTGVLQVTDSTDCTSLSPSVNAGGGRIAFDSDCDPVGTNFNRNVEIYRATLGADIEQLTDDRSTTGCLSIQASSDATGDSVAFMSDCDLVGFNPDQLDEIFQVRATGVVQLTASGDDPCVNSTPSNAPDGNAVAFESDCDLVGFNPDRNVEVFTVTKTGVVEQQSAGTSTCSSVSPSFGAGDLVAYAGYCDPTDDNHDGSYEIFRSFHGLPVQVSDGEDCSSTNPDVPSARNAVVFVSTCDPSATNADGGTELFLADLCVCGSPVNRSTPTASDALFSLQSAVGVAECALCDCDVSGDERVTASDALLTLKKAVGQSVVFDCP